MKTMYGILCRAFLSSAFILAGATAQTAGPAYEVAVIKPSRAEGDQVNRMIKPLPGGNGYMAQNFPVRLMIALMYRVPLRQVEGGSAWLDNEYFDVEARADRAYPKEELQAMFRTLLADRFGLKMHIDKRDGRLFALRTDTEVKMQPNPAGPGMDIPIMPSGPGVFVGRGVSMAYLAWFLGQQTQDKERPVVDRTGLQGTYDFKLAFLSDRLANSDRDNLSSELRDLPSLPIALREQLGLKLFPENGPVEYFVIDDVQRPSPN